jgi:uncharacterized protein
VSQVATLVAAVTASHPAWAFDCSKAYLPVDFVICSSPVLQSTNEVHEKAWTEVRAVLNEVQKQTC